MPRSTCRVNCTELIVSQNQTFNCLLAKRFEKSWIDTMWNNNNNNKRTRLRRARNEHDEYYLVEGLVNISHRLMNLWTGPWSTDKNRSSCTTFSNVETRYDKANREGKGIQLPTRFEQFYLVGQCLIRSLFHRFFVVFL